MFSAGTRFGIYEVTALIGAGGMGEVYRARDTTLGREVAIKTLPSALAKEPDRLARFEREAKLLAGLNHPHIAVVYGLGEHEGTKFFAMELVEGETLNRTLQGPLPVEAALRLALQIAEALEAAHEKGVVHRDLKPPNIMITPDGQVKVLDFGLAKAFSGDPSSTMLANSPALSLAMTQQGLILGTAGYMSPEQASGQPTDQRADIWAFSVVLFELLTGKPLFAGESVPHILADVLRTEPDWKRLPKNLHPRLKLLLERCLTKEPRNRLHSIADARVEIEAVLGDPRGVTPEAEIAASAARSSNRLRLAGAVAVTAVVAAVAGWSVYFIALRQLEAQPEASAARPVSRFAITPPATAPLASQISPDVAISPDGRRIAYVTRNLQNNTFELYVRELDALESRPLPGTETDSQAMRPFFSPDGRSIAFFAGTRGVLGVALDGGPAVRLLDTRGFVGGSWNADNTVIYSSGRRLERGTVSGGGTPEPLTAERQDGFVAIPRLLPGGRAVLFVDIAGGIENVAVLDLETGEQKWLFEGVLPFYSATGHIVFARGTTLMAAPFNLAELAVTGEPVAVLRGVRYPGPGFGPDFALAGNGTLVYVPAPIDAALGSAVVWVDRTGKAMGRAVNERVNDPRDPSLSPDGTRLLLVTGATGASELWSYDLGGRPPIPLAPPGDNFSPIWSPDGRQVAFSRTEAGSSAIVTLPADGSVLSPQTLTTEPANPKVWTAADELIVLAFSSATDTDIAAKPVRAPDGEMRRVVATGFAEIDPALSPNGRWLAYASNRTGRHEIWVQGYREGVAVRISTNGGFEPRWSADGRELYYLQGNSMMALAVETEGGFSFQAPEQLFAEPYLVSGDARTGSYDVARDGRFLMRELPGTSTDAAPDSIVVVENWAEELKRLVPSK